MSNYFHHLLLLGYKIFKQNIKYKKVHVFI